jgi:hypothetical protein
MNKDLYIYLSTYPEQPIFLTMRTGAKKEADRARIAEAVY